MGRRKLNPFESVINGCSLKLWGERRTACKGKTFAGTSLTVGGQSVDIEDAIVNTFGVSSDEIRSALRAVRLRERQAQYQKQLDEQRDALHEYKRRIDDVKAVAEKADRKQREKEAQIAVRVQERIRKRAGRWRSALELHISSALGKFAKVTLTLDGDWLTTPTNTEPLEAAPAYKAEIHCGKCGRTRSMRFNRFLAGGYRICSHMGDATWEEPVNLRGSSLLSEFDRTKYVEYGMHAARKSSTTACDSALALAARAFRGDRRSVQEINRLALQLDSGINIERHMSDYLFKENGVRVDSTRSVPNRWHISTMIAATITQLEKDKSLASVDTGFMCPEIPRVVLATSESRSQPVIVDHPTLVIRDFDGNGRCLYLISEDDLTELRKADRMNALDRKAAMKRARRLPRSTFSFRGLGQVWKICRRFSIPLDIAVASSGRTPGLAKKTLEGSIVTDEVIRLLEL